MGPKLAEILTRPGLWFAALAVALFLVLYWAIRGAPPGQAMVDDDETPDAPSTRIRDRAVGLAVAGFLLVFSGAYVAFAVGIPWSLPAFIAGFALTIGTIKVHHRYRHDSPTLRRVVGVADASVTASLLAGVLILGNIYAFKYGERPIDLTREHAYSLESLTVGQLKSLKKPLKFTIFIGQSPRAMKQRDRVLQLLELYKAVDPSRISIEELRGYAEPIKFEELARRVPDVAVAPAGGVVLEYGEGDVVDRVVVRIGEMFDNDSAAGGFDSDPTRLKTTFKGEDAITSALIRVRESKRPKIAFLVGQGEPSVHELDRARQGIGVLRMRLEALGSEILVHNLARDPLPNDATLAVIVAPRTPFSVDEAERLKAYVKNGGRMLLLIDGRSPTGLEEWLKDAYRIEVGKSVVLDPQYNVRGNRANLFAPILGDSHHPIVGPLLNRMAQMPSATPLTILPAKSAGGPGLEQAIEVILRTSNAAWSDPESNQPQAQPGPKSLRGPIPIGIAVADLPPRDAEPGTDGTPKLVVFSSPFAADNQILVSDATNLDLLINAVNWLRGRPELTGIASRTHVALRLTADPGLRSRLVVIPTILAMGLILGLAVSTYLARRS